MLIHVGIVSDQVLANLIPALIEKPGRMYLACSRGMAGKGLDRRLKALLEDRSIATTIVPGAPDAGLIGVSNYARALASRIRMEYPDGEIVFNATGGTKLMMLGFAGVFGEMGVRVLYTDTQHRRIEYFPKLGQRSAVSRPMKDVLDVREYLRAQGFIYERAASDDPDWCQRAARRSKPAEYLARYARRLGGFFSCLNKLASEALDKRGEKLVIPRQALKEAPRGDWERALREIAGARLIRRISDLEIEFLDLERTRFLRGGWLEEHAWNTVRSQKPFDARVGVCGAWEGRMRAKNEFDVLATHANQLLFIECKTLRFGGEGERASDVLYKVDSLGRDARGLFGSTWLLSALDPPDEMRERAEAQDIRIIGPDELPSLSAIVRDWMTG